MSISISAAKELALIGANISISAESAYSVSSVKEILLIAKGHGGHVTIAGSYSVSALKEFALIGKSSVTFVL